MLKDLLGFVEFIGIRLVLYWGLSDLSEQEFGRFRLDCALLAIFLLFTVSRVGNQKA